MLLTLKHLSVIFFINLFTFPISFKTFLLFINFESHDNWVTFIRNFNKTLLIKSTRISTFGTISMRYFLSFPNIFIGFHNKPIVFFWVIANCLFASFMVYHIKYRYHHHLCFYATGAVNFTLKWSTLNQLHCLTKFQKGILFELLNFFTKSLICIFITLFINFNYFGKRTSFQEIECFFIKKLRKVAEVFR